MKKVMYSFDYMDKDTVMTSVVVYDDGSVDFQNFTDDIIERAFGSKEYVDVVDVYSFFARRCISQDNDRVPDVLREFGLERYNPIEIAKRNYSLRIEDTNWVRFKGVNKSFKEVNREVYGANLVRG